MSSPSWHLQVMLQGAICNDDFQHSVAMLEQCCNHSKQCRNNAVVLFCAENRRCKSSLVTSRLKSLKSKKRSLLRLFFLRGGGGCTHRLVSFYCYTLIAFYPVCKRRPISCCHLSPRKINFIKIDKCCSTLLQCISCICLDLEKDVCFTHIALT